MLSLCMVVKDCATTLRQCLSAVSPYMDEIIIVLGGESSDDTEAVAREFTEKVYPFEWIDDFAAARNFALSLVTQPYWFWLDGDDIAVTQPHVLPDVVRWMEENGISCVWFPYVYQMDERGTPTQIQVRERIMKTADGWYWVNRIHECCACDKPGVKLHIEEGIKVIHANYSNAPVDLEKAGRNIPIIKKAIKDEPGKMRHVLALAHAEFGIERYADAMEHYTLYYYNPESKIEQWWAACQIARICLITQDFRKARGWTLAALDADGRYRDPYCLMAHVCWWGEQNGDEAIAWAQSSIGKEEAPLVVCRTPREYTLNLWDVMHRVYAQKGDYEKALKIAGQAYELEPTDDWSKFVRLYSEAIQAQGSIAAAKQLADHLTRRGDTLRARWLLEGYLPANIRDQSEITEKRALLQKITQHAYNPELYRAFYDDTNGWHEVVGTVLDPFRWEWVFERFEKAGVKSVLDVGCANGGPALEMARRGYNVTGIDIHSRNVERAQKKAEEEGLDCIFLACDLEEFHTRCRKDENFEPFDAVIMAELIEHLPPHLVGHYLRRADDLGKRVLITTPSPLVGDWPGLGEIGPTVPTPEAPREHILEFSYDQLTELAFDEYRHPVELHTLTQPWKEAGDTRQRIWVVEYDHEGVNDQPVVFFVGPGPEFWEPSSPDTAGLGGSETAVIRMAQEFAKRGHRVVVYAEADGIYDGVLYRNYKHFDPTQQFWLLVISRQPGMLDHKYNAEHVWLWCHDIQYGKQEHLDNADKILVLSQWHKGEWEHLYRNGSGPTITADGIVSPDGLLAEPQRHRFIYASSPDRGLDVLLEWWPAIRNMWSDAELHIFYGWQNLVSMSERLPHLRTFKMKVEALLDQDGLFWHGRIGQPELYKEFAKSQFWLYPSICPDGGDWYETYCITALEAQANGCIPITRPVGALPERMALPDRCLVDSRDVSKFLKALRWWDAQPRHSRESLREKMAVYAREQTWSKVCDQWLEMARSPVLV